MDRQRTDLIGGGDRSVRRLIVFMRREETAEAGFVMAKGRTIAVLTLDEDTRPIADGEILDLLQEDSISLSLFGDLLKPIFCQSWRPSIV